MKKNIRMWKMLSLGVALLFAASSCTDPDDLVTANAQGGGFVRVASGQVAYLSGQESKVTVIIPENAGITSVELYKLYNKKGTLSNEVLAVTIPVSAAGSYETSLDFSDLRSGLTIGGVEFPDDDSALGIGEYWNFRIVSTLADGRKVESATKVRVVVSNPYSGLYEATGTLHHPVSGNLVINEERTLTPVSPTTSTTIVGYFGNPAYLLSIQVNGDNSITITGDVAGSAVTNDPTYGTSHYDPETEELHLFYKYNDAAPRRIEEVLSKP